MTRSGSTSRRSTTRVAIAPAPVPAFERGQAGQASVELALLLPVLALVLLAVVQVALVARDHVLVVHAAREGARAAAVDPAPGAAPAAAVAGSTLDVERLSVDTGARTSSRTVVVSVRYRAPTAVPLVGTLIPDVLLRAKAAMRVEW